MPAHLPQNASVDLLRRALSETAGRAIPFKVLNYYNSTFTCLRDSRRGHRHCRRY